MIKSYQLGFLLSITIISYSMREEVSLTPPSTPDKDEYTEVPTLLLKNDVITSPVTSFITKKLNSLTASIQSRQAALCS